MSVLPLKLRSLLSRSGGRRRVDVLVIWRCRFMHFLTHLFPDLLYRSTEGRTNVVPIDDVTCVGFWPDIINEEDDEDSEEGFQISTPER